MRLGFALPQIGPAAGPEALVAVAQRAEELGYDDLWVLDRLLWPIAPRGRTNAGVPGSTERTGIVTGSASLGALCRGSIDAKRGLCGVSIAPGPLCGPM